MKKKQTRRKFKHLVCSPYSKSKKKYTCLTSKNIHTLKEIWNKRNPQQIINHDRPYHIWKQLKEYLINSCDNEKCWLSSLFIKYNMNMNSFLDLYSPFHPISWNNNPKEWLSDVDIKKVMKQYEMKYKTFSFIGPSPIDYDFVYHDGTCVWNDLCHFNLLKYVGKKKYIGIIFNTDVHNGPGIHWISLFINLKTNEICFFDSVSDNPPKSVNTLIYKIKNQASKIGIDLQIKINKMKHQYSNSECGMYSMFFIISLLEGTPFHILQSKRITDQEMLSKRKEYFNEPT